MDKKYIVYGASWCNYCTNAVGLLRSEGLSFHFVDASTDKQFIEEIKEFYDSPTVPVIIEIDNTTGLVSKIGGFTDLRKVLKEDD